MEIHIATQTVFEVEQDLLVFGVFQHGALSDELEQLNQRLNGALADAMQRGEFRAQWLETWVSSTLGTIKAPRVMILGLGKAEEWTDRRVRMFAGQAAQKASKGRYRRVGLVAPESSRIAGNMAELMTEGFLLGQWEFDSYKSDESRLPAEELLLIGVSSKDGDAVERGQVLAEAQNLVRDLGMRPSNLLYPEILAEEAVKAGQTYGFSVEVFDEKKLHELGMGALLGVGSGSVFPPRMVVMRYNGGGERTLALVGKGITFDSGGISLKPGLGMEDMKFDMLGAGAVLGSVIALSRLHVPINVVGIMAIAQNMPSGSAYKPGDVVKAFNGKTIEVTNTDAEGRVALADGVSYAAHLGVDWIVETSTLTGAIVVALGHEATGLVSPDDALASLVLQASEHSGEHVWRLPIYPEYRKLYRSDVADMKNSPGRDAGSITAGMIISEFAGEIPFAHLDIAGTAWTPKSPLNRTKNGPTGVMVRTFVSLAEMLSH